MSWPIDLPDGMTAEQYADDADAHRMPNGFVRVVVEDDWAREYWWLSNEPAGESS